MPRSPERLQQAAQRFVAGDDDDDLAMARRMSFRGLASGDAMTS